MRNIITQTLLISVLCLATAYAKDREGGGRPPMSAEMEEDFQACAADVGMPEWNSGERPTKEQHDAMRACLEKKGS